MASVDIAVANLPASEPAPEPTRTGPKKSDEAKVLERAEPAFYEPEVTVTAPPMYGDKTPEAAKKDEPEVKVKAETPAETPAAPKHTQEDLQAASRLGFPSDEIDQMSPVELKRAVKHAERVAQLAWDAAKQHGQAQPAQPPPV